MDMSYNQMLYLASECHHALAKKQLVEILYNKEEQKFLFLFKDNLKIIKLMVSLRKKFLAFFLTETKLNFYVPSTQFGFLKEQYLQSVKLLNEDRILELNFDKGKIIVEFFSKNPTIKSFDQQNDYILPLKPLNSILKAKLNEPINSKEFEKDFFRKEEEYNFIIQKQKILKVLNTQKKRALSLKQKLQINLAKSLEWEKVLHQGQLLKSHFYLLKQGLESISLIDWVDNQSKKIILDPNKSPNENIEDYFKQSKKRKKGIEPLTKQLQKNDDELQDLLNKELELQQICTNQDLALFEKKYSLETAKKESLIKPKDEKVKKFKQFKSLSGFPILVGKNAKDNDQLTFQIGNGSDWWFHVSDLEGSHVVVKTGKKEIDPDTIKEASLLALYYSKAKLEKRGEVVYTQIKYLKKKKGSKSGSVMISKHKKIAIELDKVKIQEIQNRS